MTHRDDREPSPPIWPYAALAAALVMVAALAVYGFVTLDRRLDAALTALGQEQDATRQRGDKPVAPAPEDIADNPPPGPQGEPGRPGRDGRNGVDGRDGEPGRDGEDGRDGVDGEPGPPGPAGADGQQGPPGSDGQDGEPPASWTWTDPDGNTYTCTRDEGSPDNAPTYTCSREPRPGPIP